MKIKVGIVGGAGYTAGELIRILLHHEFVELGGIVSSSNAGNPVHQVHDDLVGETELTFACTRMPNLRAASSCTACRS